MKPIEYNYSDSLISNVDLDQLEKQLQSEINQMKLAVTKGYNDDRASINLPDDKNNLIKVKTLINYKLKFEIVFSRVYNHLYHSIFLQPRTVHLESYLH